MMNIRRESRCWYLQEATRVITFVCGILLLSSCTNYYITLNSFKQQFAGIDSTKLLDVVVQGPGFQRLNYKANPITKIKCTDKDGNPMELANSPSIEMRITYGYKKRRTVFYFDRVFVTQNSVIGVESRMMEFIRKTIPIDSIKKIEVQDGGKDYTYLKR